MHEMILYATKDEKRGRYAVDIISRHELLPAYAEVVSLIDAEDRELMLEWAIQMARSRKTPSQMRSLCERGLYGSR